MAVVSGAEALLLEILGLRFLAYVLNADEETIGTRLQGGSQLAPNQEAALGELVAFLGTLSSGTNAQPPALRALALGALGEFREDVGVSWARAARLSLGGDDDLPRTKDAIAASLIAIAADVYPLCLLPRVDEHHFGFLMGPPLASVVYRHPQTKTFEDAVMNDETLKRLFPEANEQSGRFGAVYRSTGSAGGIQLSMLASGLLENAWEAIGHLDPDASTYARSALQQLDAIRTAIRGKPMTVKARVGITGLRLREGITVPLPWGVLREARESDRYMVPPGLSGQLSHTTEDGKQLIINYAGDLVVEMDVPYRIRLGAVDVEAGWPDLISQEALDERLETLRIALILATTRKTPPLAFGTWSVFVDPLAIGGRSSGWRDPRKGRSFTPIVLSKAEAKRWGEWIHLVDERRVKNINVAVRRTLFSAADRVDPTDALVDAVIAWENLVGSRQGEPTLRVSTALAWLLAKSAEERQELRRTIVGLYNVRSDVVHGNRFLTPQEANEKHQEALDIAVRALRAVFRSRPELLADCKDSNERSHRLILNERRRKSQAR